MCASSELELCCCPNAGETVDSAVLVVLLFAAESVPVGDLAGCLRLWIGLSRGDSGDEPGGLSAFGLSL